MNFTKATYRKARTRAMNAVYSRADILEWAKNERHYEDSTYGSWEREYLTGNGYSYRSARPTREGAVEAMTIERDTTRWGKFRDAIAWRICNFALDKIATPWYRGMISGSIRLGLESAAEVDG